MTKGQDVHVLRAHLELVEETSRDNGNINIEIDTHLMHFILIKLKVNP